MPRYTVFLANKGSKDIVRFEKVCVERPELIEKAINSARYDIVRIQEKAVPTPSDKHPKVKELDPAVAKKETVKETRKTRRVVRAKDDD